MSPETPLRPQARTPEPCLPPSICKPRLRRWGAREHLESVHGLSVAPATLAKMASTGGSPVFHKVGRTPLYPREELDRWVSGRLGRLVRSSSKLLGQ